MLRSGAEGESTLRYKVRWRLEAGKAGCAGSGGPIKLRKSMHKLIAKRLAGSKTEAKISKSDLCARVLPQRYGSDA